MSIRKISDLPYLTESQLDTADPDKNAALRKSSMELSYFLSSTAGNDPHTTYVSRQMTIQNFSDVIVGQIQNADTGFSGNKTFNDSVTFLGDAVFKNGIDVYKEIELSGDLRTPSNNNGTASLRFNSFSLTSPSLNLSPSACVDTTNPNNAKSIVNYGCLTSYVNSSLAGKLNELQKAVNDKLKELDDALAGLAGVDYNSMWPVGSIFISTTNSNICPIQGLKSGWTWQKVTGRISSGPVHWSEQKNLIRLGILSMPVCLRIRTLIPNRLVHRTAGATIKAWAVIIPARRPALRPTRSMASLKRFAHPRSSSIYGNVQSKRI